MTKSQKPTFLIELVEAAITERRLVPEGATVVVGFSGGPDSTFLLHALVALREKMELSLVVAHLDRGWRSESAQEAQFCRQQAEGLGVRFVDGHLDDLAPGLKFNGSREELARRARRLFLEKAADNVGASRIALAHHADDQQETFFIRLLRGASLSGLTCMKLQDGIYVRPLLGLRKAEILAYLAEERIPYLHDPSNDSPEFLRNRIRQTVVPALRSCDGRFDQNFAATLTRLQDAEQLLAQLVREKFVQLVEDAEEGVVVCVAGLCVQPLAMQYRILLEWLRREQVSFEPSQAFFDEMLRFLSSPRGGNHQLREGWSVAKKAGRARIVRSGVPSIVE